MATFNFKSVGKLKTSQIISDEIVAPSDEPVGIKLPLRIGDDYFELNYDVLNQIRDNLRNLLLTNYGDRLTLYDYGANLRPLLTEYAGPEDFDAEALIRIKNAVSRWMPYVSLESFASKPRFGNGSNRNTAVIDLEVYYTVPTVSNERQAINVVLYPIG